METFEANKTVQYGGIIDCAFSTLRLRQIDCNFADDIFKSFFVYENCILFQSPLKYVP